MLYPSPPDSGVVLRLTTRLVQINVIVQNPKSEPVVDLKKEDFRVNDNGKPQKISLFAVESSRTLPSVPATLPPNVFTNQLEQRPGTPASVTVILLDALNTKFTDQAYAKAQVVKFLQTIEPQDRIAIYTLGRGLRVLHDYTTDSSELLRRLAGYRGQNLAETANSEPSSLDGDTLFLDDWLRGGGVSRMEADFYTVNRIQGTLRTIEFIANHLSNLPGRKNMIWVSGGFPLTLGFDSVGAMNDPAREHRTFTEEMDRTIRAVNDANLAIYPVDARGLMADPQFSAANRSIDLKPPLGMGPIVSHQQTMEELASRTGGRAYYNTNDLKRAIRDAVEDSRTTYTIGYYPASENFDGKFHKLDVKVVDRSGLSLRYRKGYFDLAERPQDPNARKVEPRDAVWSPMDATGVGMIVQVKPTNVPKPNSLDVSVRIDRRAISLEPNGDHWAGRLDILFVQKNEQGREFNGRDDTINMNLTKLNYDRVVQQGLIYHQVLDQALQATLLRVVARDAASGTLGSVTVPFKQIVK